MALIALEWGETAGIIRPMASGEGEVIEIRLEPGGVGALLSLPASLCPSPGQYLLATPRDLPALLPIPLFPASLPAAELRVAAPLPAGWGPGTRLVLRGPLGVGFTLPQPASQVALAALGETAGALLPLARLALERGASVALYAFTLPPDLPAEVEILPLELLPEALAWADFLALDLPFDRLPDLSGRLGLRPGQRIERPAQALVRMPMPCGALAECGVCSLQTRRGWKLGCKDGPVFPLDDLVSF